MNEREGQTHHDDDTEGTSGEQQVDPRFDLVGLDVETRGDDTRLVETAVQLDDDLARAVVIDDLELADVACGCRSLVSILHFMTEGCPIKEKEKGWMSTSP
jgi:hypothetical protein